jgi:hypothetical protein
MDNEAHKIARHHLGDQLISVYRGGPYADQWTVHVGSPSVGIPGGLFTAATPDEAAREAAAQLRAAGWVPTHPRLEWGDNRLYLYTGKTRFVVATYLLPACDVLIHPDFSEWRRCYSQAAMVATIAEWCAANLPNYHLPPFPGASQ